jgi:hypothetical protein
MNIIQHDCEFLLQNMMNSQATYFLLLKIYLILNSGATKHIVCSHSFLTFLKHVESDNEELPNNSSTQDIHIRQDFSLQIYS